MFIKTLVALLFFVAVSFTGNSQRPLGFSLPEGKNHVTIPIEIRNNLIIIPVVINGQLPLRFILDTGVRTAILTQKSYSDILGLPYSRQYTIAGPGGEHLITAYVANNVSLFIPPGVQGNGHALLVLEKDYLELRNYLGAEVHGILGYELFSRFVVLINYQEKFIELLNPAQFKVGRKYHRMDISIEDTKPFLRTTANLGKSKELKLMVDTGASHGLLLDPQSDTAIHVPQKNIATVIGRALGGEVTGKIGRIKSLQLGKYDLKEVIASYPDPNSYMDTLKASTVARNGTIGGEILSRFTVIFDYSGGKLYLKKNSSYKKEFQSNLSGITLKAKGSNLKVFEIIQIRKNSIADLEGIQEGDLLISLNGSPASGFSLNELNGELNSKPGKQITLLLEREGVRIKKTLILKQEI